MIVTYRAARQNDALSEFYTAGGNFPAKENGFGLVDHWLIAGRVSGSPVEVPLAWPTRRRICQHQKHGATTGC